MTKRISVLLTTILALLMYSCDTIDPSFDESLPDLLTLSLNASPAEGGTLTPGEGEFLNGEVIEIEAVPAEGFIFERWEGDFESESNPASLVMTENKTVTAFFREIYTLIHIETSGEGTVLTDFDHQTVSLSAIPIDGWTFSRWEGDLSGNENPETLFLDGEKNITAIFNPLFNLAIDVIGRGSVKTDPDQKFYEKGDKVSLTATSESGWRFTEWKGDISGTENPIQVTIDGDKSATAVFERCILC